MKKIIFSLLILISISATGQNIDTVLVRNLQLQAQDWAWLVGKLSPAINSDSASAKEFRRIRDRIRTANPAAWTTNVTIDSIPGFAVLAFYRVVKLSRAGEIAPRYAAITSVIESKSNMTFFIAPINTAVLTDFNTARDLGKHIVMDQ